METNQRGTAWFWLVISLKSLVKRSIFRHRGAGSFHGADNDNLIKGHFLWKKKKIFSFLFPVSPARCQNETNLVSAARCDERQPLQWEPPRCPAHLLAGMCCHSPSPWARRSWSGAASGTLSRDNRGKERCWGSKQTKNNKKKKKEEEEEEDKDEEKKKKKRTKKKKKKRKKKKKKRKKNKKKFGQSVWIESSSTDRPVGQPRVRQVWCNKSSSQIIKRKVGEPAF